MKTRGPCGLWFFTVRDSADTFRMCYDKVVAREQFPVNEQKFSG